MPKLNSVLKNVPIELRNELVKYHTKNSRHRLRWKGREPKPGKKYSKWGGSLSLENAKSADLYVDNIEPLSNYHRDILLLFLKKVLHL